MSNNSPTDELIEEIFRDCARSTTSDAALALAYCLITICLQNGYAKEEALASFSTQWDVQKLMREKRLQEQDKRRTLNG